MANTIEAHAKWSRVEGLALSTIGSRVRLLQHADKHLPQGLFRAVPDELVDYLDNPDWAPWTLCTYDGYLRRYFDWALRTEQLVDDPMRYLRRPPEGDRLPDPITDDELAYLLTNAPEKPWRLAFLLAAYAGLRVSELARLRRQDITEEHIRVRKGKGTGGGKDAVVDTHPLIWEAVKDLPAEEVVRDPDGQPVTGYQLINRGWYLYRSLNMPEMRMHRLRHWHATALLRGGADLETVRQCMRHASITSTAGYTLIDSGRRRAAVHRLAPVILEPVSTRLEDPTTEAA